MAKRFYCLFRIEPQADLRPLVRYFRFTGHAAVRDSNVLRTAIGNGISFLETFADGSILRPRTIGGGVTELVLGVEPCTIGGKAGLVACFETTIGGAGFFLAGALMIGGTEAVFLADESTGFVSTDSGLNVLGCLAFAVTVSRGLLTAA